MQAPSSITDAQRRETLLELMENTFKPRQAAASLGMELVQPMRPAPGQQQARPCRILCSPDNRSMYPCQMRD